MSNTANPRKLGLAVIGCGEQGLINANAAKQSRVVELVQVMDVNAEVARSAGEKLGVAAATDYAAVLGNERVDIVFLNTPHNMHAALAVQAAEKKKHIIVEKPLATTVADAVAMARAAKAQGVQLAMWLGKRYQPAVVKARELVQAGLLGEKLIGANLVFHNHKTPAYWKGGFSGKSTDWRGRWEPSGGGVLIMTGIHFLDWLIFLGGEKIVELSARYATLGSPVEVEDTLTMWMRFAGGGLATCNLSSAVRGGRGDIMELRLYGDAGHLSLTPPAQFYATRLLDGKAPERWQPLEPLPSLPREQITFLDKFGDAVLAGQPFEITPQEAVDLQVLCEAAYRSARENRVVTMEYPQV